jgi:hypothetical protein
MKTELRAMALTDDPEYARQAAKLDELRARAADLERRRSQLSTGLAADAARDELTRRAQALLDDDAVPRGHDAEAARMRADLETVTDELAVTRKAADLQAVVVEREARRVSREVCARVHPAYRAIVARAAAALEAASAAFEEERRLRESAIDGGIQFAAHLRVMTLPALGLLSDTDSRVSLWFREAREHGLLD